MSFSIGILVVTPLVMELIANNRIDVSAALRRHIEGDWGAVDTHDRRANDQAVLNGERIVSVYGDGDAKFWIITEADRSATTVLRPEEY